MCDLTIIMPSYNKEKYIGEALDSIFMQKTNYSYKIIVADDCSSDSTVEIVKEYQKKYPNVITLLTSETNQKLYRNVLRAYEITKSDYFCVLDPDDYWISDSKIQNSLDFLENNKDYTIYVTDTDMLLPNGKTKKFIRRKNVVDYDFNDLLKGKALLGCTLGSMFRNVIFKDGVPKKMLDFSNPTIEQSYRGDTFRSIIHLHEGKAHCVPCVDAIYRSTPEGLWQGISSLNQNVASVIINKDMWLYFDKKYYQFINRAKIKLSKIKNDDVFLELCNQKSLEEGLEIIKKIAALEEWFKKYTNEPINIPFKYKIWLYTCKFIEKNLKKCDIC